jgi:diaminopimelate decarboxylase
MARAAEAARGLSRAVRPALPALLHPFSLQLADRHADLLRDLIHGLGSPLHVVLPQVFDATVAAFRHALEASGVAGRVLYAKKANKARCFAQRCAALGIGIDAASAQELERALGAGVHGVNIGVSGPDKSPELLTLALLHGCMVAIDSPQELQRIVALARHTGRRARLLLRCCPDTDPPDRSRFGLQAAELDHALEVCSRERGSVHLKGFAFHLSGYRTDARARMADRMVDLCLQARAQDLPCDTVNIGGGFAVRYAEPADWARFQDQQSPEHYHAGKTFEDFYPYGAQRAGADMLADILASPAGEGRSLAQRLRQHDIQLLLEPGRALLDQAGCTAVRIQGVKDRHATRGYALLTAEGTSFSLSEQWFNSEYLPDPLLLGAPASADGPVFSACVGGASCLDSDMLTWRKLALPRPVEPGDVLLYPNTAGYQMDSNESPFHELPLPRKVVATLDGERMHWRLDDVADSSPNPCQEPTA